MKTMNRKNKIRKILGIVLISLAGLLIIGGISAYLLVHSYINKMHLVSTQTMDSKSIETESSSDNSVNTTENEVQLFSQNEEYLISQDMASTEVSGQTLEQELEEENNLQDAPIDEINLLDNQIDDNITNNSVLMDDKQVTNILFIGSDTRISDQSGRSDSMIVISINKETKKIIATSFLRDIYLQIPGKEKNRLNAAYAIGGVDLLLETLQQNFKFKIDKYIMVDFFAFIHIVDAIGGITIDIDKDELDTMNSYITEINTLLGEKADADFLTKSGTLLLNGKQALGYARNRYTKKGDFDRTEKQRVILMTIYEKIKKQDLLEMNELLNSILPEITTNFTENEILAHFFMLPDYLNYEIEELSIPVAGTYDNLNVRGMAVLGIDFENNIKKLYKKIYNVEE